MVQCSLILCPCKLLSFTRKHKSRKLLSIIDNYLPKEVSYVGNA